MPLVRSCALIYPRSAANIGLSLSEGGDTDTNACIVGGMLGAAEGLDKIPDCMKTPMITFKPKKGVGAVGKYRPDFLVPSHCLLSNLDAIYAKSPSAAIVLLFEFFE